ncbi:hypothetical protein Tco_1529530, partial [Tanacetum coccineum]
RFARLQEVRFNFDQKDQETPRIVGDDSARSEPTEVADSNNFKPLLKEKRLKEQTDFVGDNKGKKETLDVYKRSVKQEWKALKKISCVFAINATLEQERIHSIG